MQKNVASQKLMVFAFDSTTNLPKTGDAANITAYESLDYGTVTVLGDTSATEMDSTNAKGYYLFDLTQAETNGNTILFTAKSSTSNVVVIGAPAVVQTVPAAFALVGGAAGGLMIAGSNAATTFATLTVSGAVAFQSTFAVTTSTSLGALSCTTLTASGAVAFQSTFAVTTSTNLAALSCSTFAASGTVTFNAFTVTNAMTVSGTTTLTGAVTASNAGNNVVGVALATAQAFNNTGTWTGNIVGTLSTLTTYTGNTPQTGDSFARIGATGSGLTSLAPSATALSTATWTGTLASNLTTLASHDPGGTLASSANQTTINNNVVAIPAAITSDHGSGSYQTATGFSTPTNVTDAVTAIEVYGQAHWVTATGFAVAGDTMRQDMAQAVPESNTAQTVGDALNAARAQGFGPWTLVGTTLTLYASDGVTAVRTFTLDSATAPTSRT